MVDYVVTWPQVSILLITYKRLNLAKRVVSALDTYLRYSGPIHWHIADDGSGEAYVNSLARYIANRRSARGLDEAITFTVTDRKGAGANMNAGQAVCWMKSDYVLWLEDDWELLADFDLHRCVRVLYECKDVGMIRLGYLQKGIKGTLRSGAGDLWWRIAWDSEDPYVFAGHAGLRHKRFYEAYGPYPEGYTPGDTESEFAKIVNAKQGPVMIWPAWIGCWGAFGHIGAASLAGLQPGADWGGEETRETSTEGIGLAPELRSK